MIGRFDLTDWEWSIIEPLLPGGASRKARGRPRTNDRSDMGPIRQPITASIVGPSAGSGVRCSGHWPNARPAACA
jgi:hypothetical protein